MKLSNSMRSGNRLLYACAAVLAAAVALPKAAHAATITVPPVPDAVKVDPPNEVFLVGHAIVESSFNKCHQYDGQDETRSSHDWRQVQEFI